VLNAQTFGTRYDIQRHDGACALACSPGQTSVLLSDADKQFCNISGVVDVDDIVTMML
jgi:hypothetical protein